MPERPDYLDPDNHEAHVRFMAEHDGNYIACAEGCTSAYGLAVEVLRLRDVLASLRRLDVIRRSEAVRTLRVQNLLSDMSPLDPFYLGRLADKIGALPSVFEEVANGVPGVVSEELAESIGQMRRGEGHQVRWAGEATRRPVQE